VLSATRWMHEHKDGDAAWRDDALQAAEIGPAMAELAITLRPSAARPARSAVVFIALPFVTEARFPPAFLPALGRTMQGSEPIFKPGGDLL
jgi:hypothetical protein